MKEVWRPIDWAEGYYDVSNRGRVRRMKPGPGTWVGRILKHGVSKLYPYPIVVLTFNNIGHTCNVHKLVARAFLGPCPKGMEVNHKDLHDKSPRVSNLEYMTRPENAKHAFSNGAAQRKRIKTMRRLIAAGVRNYDYKSSPILRKTISDTMKRLHRSGELVINGVKLSSTRRRLIRAGKLGPRYDGNGKFLGICRLDKLTKETK